jgi:hypothetical protein
MIISSGEAMILVRIRPSWKKARSSFKDHKHYLYVSFRIRADFAKMADAEVLIYVSRQLE